MDIIHLLPDSVANQIAAGEVIQRPASCLKELVENSLDAGAKSIQVIIRDAGRTLLQVIDDGSGMSETDARMAFERHATSKIRQASDLFALHTMGFRGEALASIAAVAQVEVLTRRADDELGTLLEIAGSQVVRQEPTAAPVGTSIKVKNLFYNVPARRRFLKTDNTELRNIISDFYRIVLVYPHVQFLLVSDDEILLDLPAVSLKQRIEDIFGKQRKQYAQQLVEIHSETPMVNIYGYIGKPEAANKQAQQYFFVNGRYMKHPYFHKAVMTAYAGMLLPEQNPNYFIYFDIQPDAIDVNIHPTKTEIKFADEQSIWQILLATLRESLGKFNITPSLDFNREGDIQIPSVPTNRTGIKQPTVSVNQQYNPFEMQRHKDYVPTQWQTLYPDREGEGYTNSQLAATDAQPHLTPIGEPYQYNAQYILQPVIEGLLLINQHRASVVVMYQHFLTNILTQQPTTQQVLFPEILDLSAAEAQLIEALLPDLQSVGFDISQFSPNSYAINGVPAELGAQSANQLVMDILHTAAETAQSSKDLYQQHIARQLATETAIKEGKELSVAEMKDLITRLFALPQYMRTPQGKRVMILLENEELDKRFDI